MKEHEGPKKTSIGLWNWFMHKGLLISWLLFFCFDILELFMQKLCKVIVASPKATTQDVTKSQNKPWLFKGFKNYRKCKLLQPFLAKATCKMACVSKSFKSKEKEKRKKKNKGNKLPIVF